METTLLDRAVAAVTTPVQQATEAVSEFAGQARDVKARASDAAEEYRRAITREVGRAARRVDYARQASAYRIQQAPFAAVAIACAAGFLGGAATAWALLRARGGDEPAKESTPR